MASNASFDISTGADLQEVDNAVNQALKEIGQRYDFKGTHCTVEFDRAKAEIRLAADDEFRMEALARRAARPDDQAGRAGQESQGRRSRCRPRAVRCAGPSTLTQGIARTPPRRSSRRSRTEDSRRSRRAIQGEEIRVTGPSERRPPGGHGVSAGPGFRDRAASSATTGAERRAGLRAGAALALVALCGLRQARAGSGRPGRRRRPRSPMVRVGLVVARRIGRRGRRRAAGGDRLRTAVSARNRRRGGRGERHHRVRASPSDRPAGAAAGTPSSSRRAGRPAALSVRVNGRDVSGRRDRCWRDRTGLTVVNRVALESLPRRRRVGRNGPSRTRPSRRRWRAGRRLPHLRAAEPGTLGAGRVRLTRHGGRPGLRRGRRRRRR